MVIVVRVEKNIKSFSSKTEMRDRISERRKERRPQAGFETSDCLQGDGRVRKDDFKQEAVFEAGTPVSAVISTNSDPLCPVSSYRVPFC